MNHRHSVRPARVVRPRNLAELQELLQSSEDSIKVVGGLYSVSSCALPPEHGLAVDLGAFDEVGMPEDGRVQVGAGTTMRQLLDRLRGTGLQPGVVPLLGNFSVGAISGTPFYDLAVANSSHAHFSTDVVEYRLVLADGSLKTVSEESNPELMFFLRTHQGLLGVVYQVTLQLHPLRMHRVSFGSQLLEEHLADPAASRNDYLYVFPGSDRLIFERHERQEEAAIRRSDLVTRRYLGLATLLDRFANRLVPPLWVPRFQRALQTLFVLKTRWLGAGRLNPLERSQLGAARRSIALTDWQFPEEGYLRALPALLDLCERFRDEHGFGPAFISVYFVPRNERGAGYSSREADQYSVDLISYFPDHPQQARLEEAWSSLARELGGRASLNKNSDATLRASDMQHVFGEEDYRRFRALCTELDPGGRFRNPLLGSLFGE